MRISQRIVGVDLSPRVARIVVLETTLRKTEVAQVAALPLTEGQDRKEVLAAVRAAVGDPIDSLIVAADAKTTSTRLLRFPFGDLRKVEPAIAFELENQVPYDMAETALTWHVATRTSAETQVLAALTPKKGLRETIADAEASRLEPRVVCPAEVGLAHLVPEHDAAEPVAVVSLGETATHVAVLHNGLRYTRTLRAGGQDIDRALAKAFAVDLATAKRAKEGAVEVLSTGDKARSTEEIAQVVAQGLAVVVTGLSTTFKSLPREDAPVRLYLTGGLSRLSGLCDFLSQKLGLPVELLDLAAVMQAIDRPKATARKGPRVPRFLGRRRAAKEAGDAGAAAIGPAPEGPDAGTSHEFAGAVDLRAEAAAGATAEMTPIAPELAPALGLALSLSRYGRSAPLNFRRGEFAYEGDIQLYRGHLTRLAVGVGAVILLAIAGSVVRYTMISAEEKRVNEAFCSVTKKVIGREICNPTVAIATLKQGQGPADGVAIPMYSAATLLEMMSKQIGKELDVTFDELELRVDGRVGGEDRITGKGEAASFETTEQVATSLKRDPCVQDVEISKQRKTRDGGRVEFNISVKVSCPAGATPGHPPEQPTAAQGGPAGAPGLPPLPGEGGAAEEIP